MSHLNTLVEKIRYSSREMVRELGLLMAEDPYGLPISFRHTLIELNQHGPLTHQALALFLRLDKSTVSRMIKKLIQQKLVLIKTDSEDLRYKRIVLTATGKAALLKINAIANQQVHEALLQLSESDQVNVAASMDLYAKSLKRSRIQNEFLIRPINKNDNLEMLMIIKQVLKEYGADRPGFAFVDHDLDDLCKTFNKNKSEYYVIERKSDNHLIGGAGIGPLEAELDTICELKKMYLLPEARGFGLGYHLLQMLLTCAKKYSYKKCYLETLKSMEKANQLYSKMGFLLLDKPLGNTGHYGCDTWYVKKL